MNILDIQTALKKVNEEYVTEEYCDTWKPMMKPQVKLIDFLINILEGELDIKFIHQLKFIKELGQNSQFRKENILSYIEAWIYCSLIDQFDIKQKGRKNVIQMVHKFIEQPGQPIKNLIQNVGTVQGFKEDEISEIYPEIQNHSYYQQYLASLQKQEKQLQAPPIVIPQAPPQIDKITIIELFENSIEDLSKMPTSCPQSLIQQLIQTAMMKEYSFLQGQQRIVTLDDLQLCLVKHEKINPKIKTLLQESKNNPNTQQQKLHGIRKQICEINIHQLERLIKKTEKAKQQIRNQEIIFFIGTTGAGKTTTILKALGYLLKLGIKANLVTLVPQGQLKKEHQSLITSPESKSITRFIFAAEIPQQFFPTGKEKKIFICDSPGFGDSAGVQVDIANGVGMIQGIRQCKSVRIALVMSAKNWGDRGQGPKELGKIIAELFNDYDEIQDSVSFIFNKYTETQENQLPNKCKDLIDNRSQIEKGQTKYCSFLSHLNEVANSDDKIMMQPLKIDTKAFIKKLMASKPIKDPSEHFKYSFTDKTKQSIKSTIVEKAKVIMESFNEGRYDHTIYYAELLKTFATLINSIEGKQIYKNCISKIQKETKTFYELYERNLKQRILVNQANEDTITEMKQCEEKIQGIQCLGKIAKIPTMIQLKQMKKSASNNLIQQLEKDDLVLDLISAAKQFAKYFDDKLDKQIDQIMISKFKIVQKNLLNTIKNETYEQLKDLWQKYLVISKSMQLIKMDKWIKQSNQKLMKSLDQNMNKYVASIEQKLMISLSNQSTHILKQAVINKPIPNQTINETNNILEKLNLIINASLPNTEETRTLRKKIINSIVISTRKMLQLSNETVYQCEQVGNPLQDKICRTIKNCQINAQKFISFQEVNDNVGSQVRHSRQKMKNLINSQISYLKQIIEAFKGEKIDGIKSKLIHIKQTIARVRSLSQSGEDQTLVIAASELEADVKNSIQQYLTTQHTQAKRLSLNLRLFSVDLIQKNLFKLQQIELFKKYVDITTEIKSTIIDIETTLKNNLMAPIIEIRNKSQQVKQNYKTFKVGIDNYQKFSVYLNILGDNNNNQDISNTIKQTLNEIIDYLKIPFKKIDEQMNNQLELLQKSILKRENIQKIREILRIINSINSKTHFSMYLSINDIYDTQNILEKVSESIVEKINQYRKEFQEIKHNTNIKAVQDYHTMCKNLQEIDRQLPIKNEDLNQLIKQINEAMISCQGNVTDLIGRAFSEHTNQINENFLKQAYSQVENNNTAEAIKKKQNITNKMLELQEKIKTSIKECQTTLDFGGEDGDRRKTQMTLLRNLEDGFKFKQTVEKVIKDQGERKWMSINEQYLSQSGLNMFSSLIENYNQIIQLIKEYCLKEAKDRIKYLRANEKVMVKIMWNDEKFKSELKKKIEQNFWQEDQPNMKFKDGTITTLCSKLEIIIKMEQEKAKKIFLPQDNNLQISKDLTKYFHKAQQQTKKILAEKISAKVNSELKEYQDFYSEDCDKAQKKLQQLKKKIDVLPIELKTQIENKLKSTKEKIVEEQQKQISQFKVGKDQAFPTIQAIRKINKVHAKGNKNLEKKIKECLKKQINKAISKQNLTTNQALEIFQQQFVNIYKLSKNEIQQTQSIKQVYEEKQKNIVQQILSDILSKSAQFYHSIDHKSQIGLQSKIKINHEQNVNCIFKVYECFMKSQKDLITKENQKIKNSFEQFVKKVTQEYAKRLTELNPQKIWKAKQSQQKQSSVTAIIKARSVSEKFIFVRKNCEDTSFQQNQVIKNCLQAYNNVQTYEQKMKKITNKVKETAKSIQQFEICGDNIISSSEEGIANCLLQVDNQFSHIERIQSILDDANEIKRIEQVKVKEVKKQFHSNIQQKVKEAVNQAENCFKSDESKSAKVDVIVRIMKTMKKNKINVMKLSVDPIKQIQEKMNQNYTNYSEKIKQNLMKIKKNEQTYAKNETQLVKNMNKQIQNKQNQFDKQKDTKIQNIKKIKQKFIEDQTDQNKKQKLRQEMESEIDGIKKDFGNNKKEFQNQVQNGFKTKLQNLNKEMFANMIQIANQLVHLKKANFLIQQCYKEQSDNILNQHLKSLKELKKRTLKHIISAIKEHQDETYAQMLISQSDVFKIENAQKFQRLVQNQGIEYVLKNIAISEEKLKQLSKYYKLYEKQFNKQLRNYESEPNQITINTLADSIKTQSKKLNEFYIKGQKDPGSDIKSELLAQIFALWTISKADVSEGEVTYLYKPHPAQIVAILLLLSMGNKAKEQALSNKMAQVGTGEGKSVILAGLCAYLALVGYKVCCACYSAYLSNRDQQAFSELFTKLDLKDRIKYGTFNDHCKDILNPSSEETFESTIDKYINYQKGFFQKFKGVFGFQKIFEKSEKKDKKILIIDEVDVFFDEKFFGQMYCPSITLKDQSIDQLLQYIWDQVKVNAEIMPQDILKSSQFKKVIQKYPNLKKLLKNQVSGMIAGARGYQHEYLVVNNRIVYKDNDTISQTLNYGFKTVFANFFEYRKNSISELAWKAALEISLITAQFSYAELPNFFNVILGVTGTLEIMPEYKKHQLKQRYTVGQMFVIPSVYGNTKRRVQNYKITGTTNHYEQVVQNIKEHFEKKQPIIVFFKTAKNVITFYNSQQLKPLKGNATFLTQQHDAETRDQRIKRASQSQQITLFTQSFGRGTDFVIYNKAVQSSGGLHVTQAYLSIDESQEIQVKGRTARQGKNGSYDLIVPENELQLINLSKIDENKIADELWQGRKKTNQIKSKGVLQNLNSAHKKHKQVIDLYSSSAISQQKLIDYIFSLNKCPQVTKLKNRTVLALDATCSMSNALAKVLSILDAAFTRTYQILEIKKVKGTFQLQIVVYRNYNSDANMLLQTTSFENRPHNIKEFLKTVNASGGWGNEAIEVCLSHINKLSNIDQVILIADAAANKPQQTVQKRKRIKGQSYWLQNNYPLTYIDIQTSKMINSKIPIHTFYLGAKQYFESLSAQTNGKSEQFRIHDSNASEKLAAFIVENVLLSIGGKENGIALVQEYRKRYK